MTYIQKNGISKSANTFYSAIAMVTRLGWSLSWIILLYERA
ncbi:hypothetical protein [Mesobacillus foraminis]|nr:hypothetical protein [Mesobacillus foraminis]